MRRHALLLAALLPLGCGEEDTGTALCDGWFDEDDDGYGDAEHPVTFDCGLDPDHVADNADDCDDLHEDAHPGAEEHTLPADWVDNDCDGLVDECSDTDPGLTWHSTEVCDGIDNDCDGAVDEDYVEVCDGEDNDCDGLVDEDFADTDEDGTVDCLDTETCDGLDNDGDGTVDEEYADTDKDGTADCVDVETCDGLDNDGDGTVDDGVLGTGEACAVDSCLALAAAAPGTPDGAAWIDPGGAGAPFEAWCDMTTDGGGWTLVTNVLSIDYTWTPSGSLEDDFIFDEDTARRVAEVSTTIRYRCQHPTDATWIDIATADPLWLVRPYTRGDACTEGYNWTPDTSGFVALPDHNHVLSPPQAIGCSGEDDTLLATYPIGFDAYDWFIDDVWYVGDEVTPLCAGAAPAAYMRVFYR